MSGSEAALINAAWGAWQPVEGAPADPVDVGQLDFGMEGFDINAAFQYAASQVASDTELAIEEKVRRMETIVTEGSSELYRSFVDFRALASQVEMMCAHDHMLGQEMQGSSTISGFMTGHGSEDPRSGGHDHDHHDGHGNDDEIDPKTGKKKKKKRSLLDYLLG